LRGGGLVMKCGDLVESAVSVGVVCTLCPYVRHVGGGAFLILEIVQNRGALKSKCRKPVGCFASLKHRI
jgi:hypothetical protein